MKLLTLSFILTCFTVFCEELTINSYSKNRNIIYELKKNQPTENNDRFKKPKLKLGKRVDTSEEKKILEEKYNSLVNEYSLLQAEKEKLLTENKLYENELKNIKN